MLCTASDDFKFKTECTVKAVQGHNCVSIDWWKRRPFILFLANRSASEATPTNSENYTIFHFSQLFTFRTFSTTSATISANFWKPLDFVNQTWFKRIQIPSDEAIFSSKQKCFFLLLTCKLVRNWFDSSNIPNSREFMWAWNGWQSMKLSKKTEKYKWNNI